MSAILYFAALTALNCASPQTNAEMGQCAVNDYRRADVAMNRQWLTTMAVMKRADRDLDRTYDKRIGYAPALLAAQQAWLKFRDTHCATEGYAMRGGSGEPSLIVGCKTTLTEARTKQLRFLAEVL